MQKKRRIPDKKSLKCPPLNLLVPQVLQHTEDLTARLEQNLKKDRIGAPAPVAPLQRLEKKIKNTSLDSLLRTSGPVHPITGDQQLTGDAQYTKGTVVLNAHCDLFDSSRCTAA